jgi:hypothetical protein
MFTKTTSLLPEGLFASLGVTRGVESDTWCEIGNFLPIQILTAIILQIPGYRP